MPWRSAARGRWFGLASLVVLLAVLLGSNTASHAQQPAHLSYLHIFGGAPGDGKSAFLPLLLGQGNVLYGSTLAGGTNNAGMLFKLDIDGGGYTVLYNFTTGQHYGDAPIAGPGGAPLAQGPDGALYGTLAYGLDYQNGMVFKVNIDGSGFTVLHNFNAADAGPISLMLGSDGALYGTAYATVFKLTTDGSNYMVLRQFGGTNGGGVALNGTLIQDAGGTLYGTAFGSGSGGTAFKLNTDGSGYQSLHTFLTDGVDGSEPWAGLTPGSDGALYGTTTAGGTNGAGTVFKLNADGSGYQILHNFLTNSVDGQIPYGGLVQGLDGKLYGTTRNGGTNSTVGFSGGGGTIFEMNRDGSGYAILQNFNTSTNTGEPYAGLVQGPASNGSGALYGTTSSGLNGSVFGIVVNPPLTITPAISQTGTTPVITWPAWALNYVLQTTTNLSSGIWTPTTNGLPISGLQLTNTPNPNAYYRLMLP